MRLAKECKVAIIEKTYDGGVCLPERSANMSLRGKLVVFWMKHRPRHIATTQMVALMFAAIILLGALLLTLPAASRDGVSCGLRPALFTATSATCVTGLVLYDTWSQWSGFGQIVILCLIQIGGLGFMSVATLLIFLLRRKIGLQQRLMIAQSLSVNDIKGVVRLQKLVLTGSFSVEAVGAIILTLRFWPEYGFTRALRWGIFHSVSAFCNAGFDLFGQFGAYSSLVPYVHNYYVQAVVMFMIIAGGLGFMVWVELIQYPKKRKLSLHARVVLIFSVLLWVGGAALIGLMEWNNPASMGGLSMSDKIMASLFQSVSTRTAGMNTIDLAACGPITKLLMSVLQFIGAAPGSTGGGVKVTTFAVLFLTIRSVAQGRDDCVIADHHIESKTVYRALTIIVIGALAAFGSAVVVYYNTSDAVSVIDAIFESCSAFGTVGLSVGVTARLKDGAKLLYMAVMFMGRVGPVSLAMSLTAKPDDNKRKIMPVGHINVG